MDFKPTAASASGSIRDTSTTPLGLTDLAQVPRDVRRPDRAMQRPGSCSAHATFAPGAEVTEGVFLRRTATWPRPTASPKRCMAGGVALNCVANGKVLRATAIRATGFCQTRSGDGGGALSAQLNRRSTALHRRQAADLNGARDGMKAPTSAPASTQAHIGSVLPEPERGSHATDDETTLDRPVTRGCWPRRRFVPGAHEFGPRRARAPAPFYGVRANPR